MMDERAAGGYSSFVESFQSDEREQDRQALAVVIAAVAECSLTLVTTNVSSIPFDGRLT